MVRAHRNQFWDKLDDKAHILLNCGHRRVGHVSVVRRGENMHECIVLLARGGRETSMIPVIVVRGMMATKEASRLVRARSQLGMFAESPLPGC